MSNPKICILLPTKNEEKSIASVISSLRKYCSENSIDLIDIIITDDSNDMTRSIAKDNNVSVIIAGGRGLGHAMRKGLKHASSIECDAIVTMDSDGQVDFNEIKKFITPIINDEADLIVGSRFIEDGLVKYRYPFINRFGVHILSWIISKSINQKITDSHGGIRAMKPIVANHLELIGTHTYVQESIIDAYENGFRVKEIPSVWLKREHGKSRVVFSITKYIFYTLPVLILRSGNHIKTLFPIGSFLLLLSLLDFLIVGFQTRFSLEELFERQSFHMIIMLFSMGLNVILFAFTLELLSHIKRKH